MSKRVKQDKGRPQTNAPEVYRHRITAVLKKDISKIETILKTKVVLSSQPMSSIQLV